MSATFNTHGCLYIIALYLALANGTLSLAAETEQPDNMRGSTITLLREFRPIGGANNNLRHPAYDAIPGSPELNLTPLQFSDSSNGLIDGPNPRTISNVISGGTSSSGANGETNDTVASAWLYVFGQFIDHDLGLESSPPTAADISITIPQGDPFFPAGNTIVMTRCVRSTATNTIINTVAGYLDLSQLYGDDQATAASLRNADGTLQSTENGQYLPIVDDNFVTGDPRVMENAELTAVTTLFMREHNYWVATLKTQHPKWTGDELYNMARAINTAEYQNIIYKEYLPVLIGNVLGEYRGYNPHVQAQVSQEFTAGAFRVGHSQVSDTQAGRDNDNNVTFTESLAQSFFNSPEIDEANGIDAVIRDVGQDFSQATDVYAVPVLRNMLFAGLVGGDIDQIDLIAIDIQRERDVGLGTLNQTRSALGLPVYSSFAALTSDTTLQTNLQTVYGNINNVDLFIGGLAENHARGALVGQTFQVIIADQFRRLREGDRFFWLNQDFDRRTQEMIERTTLADIVARDTDTAAPFVLQANLFLAPTTATTAPTRPNRHIKVQPSDIDFHGRNVSLK